MGHVAKQNGPELPVLSPAELKNEIKHTMQSLTGKSDREEIKPQKTPIQRRSISRTSSFSDSTSKSPNVTA